MLAYIMFSLLHFPGVRSIAKPYDIPFAQNYVPIEPCELRLPPSLHVVNESIPRDGRGNFAQPIHHGNLELGLFSQAFLWNRTFWRPGAPIVVFLPGESRIDNFGIHARPDFSTVGIIAEHIGAAILTLEHRYFGSSFPYRNLTKANLQYLTVDNALQDIVRFAENFVAPWTDVPTTAKDVPWILIGGSYSAAQTAWIANIMPGTFWAYLSASPILQAIPSYWAFFLPLTEHAPQSCVNSMSSIIEFVDNIIEDGDKQALHIIKALFGLADMQTSDFLYNLSFYWSEWSTIDLGQTYSTIDTYCSWIEGSEDKRLEQMYQELFPPAVRRVTKSLKARADWATSLEQTLRALQTYSEHFRKTLAPRLCVQGHCLNDTSGRHSEPFLPSQMYQWLLCNDMMGGYTTGAPVGTTSKPLVSRFLTLDYFQKRCARFYSLGPSGELESAGIGHRSAEEFNRYTGGWYPTNARRIIYSAGEMDVWREMSASAKLRPRGPLESNPEMDVVVHLVKTGYHHSEMSTRNAELDKEVRRVRDAEVDQICRWVQQWPGYDR